MFLPTVRSVKNSNLIKLQPSCICSYIYMTVSKRFSSLSSLTSNIILCLGLAHSELSRSYSLLSYRIYTKRRFDHSYFFPVLVLNNTSSNHCFSASLFPHSFFIKTLHSHMEDTKCYGLRNNPIISYFCVSPSSQIDVTHFWEVGLRFYIH